MNNKGMPQIMLDFIKLSNDLYQKEKIRENIVQNDKIDYLREELELLSRVEYIFKIIYQDKKYFSSDFKDPITRKHFIQTLESIKKLVGKRVLKNKCVLREDLETEIQLLRTNNYDKRGVRGNNFLKFVIGSFTLITIILASNSCFASKYKFANGNEIDYSQKDAQVFVQKSIDKYGAQTFLEILKIDLNNPTLDKNMKEEIRFIQTMSKDSKILDSNINPHYDLTFEQRNKLNNLISGQVYHNRQGPLDSDELEKIREAIGFTSQNNFSIKKTIYDTKLQQVIDKNLDFFESKYQNYLR